MATEKKQPTNWESPTAPSIEESRNTGSEMINDPLLGKTIIKNKKMKEGYYVFLLAGVDARL